MPGWGIDSAKSVEIARLAVETRVCPLYEIENGILKITKDVKEPKPVIEYLKTQTRFKHLSEEQVKEIQAFIDKEWARIKELEKKKCRFY